MYEDLLFLIPARGGSKGIPRKNIRELKGIPLIYYTLSAIKEIAPIDNICISSEDHEIISIVRNFGFNVPFVRPMQLATDTSTTDEVIEHALGFYMAQGRSFRGIVLLQPTSPLRKTKHIIEAISLYNHSNDFIVSVKVTKSNPYYILFEENSNGFLELSKKGNFTRRQDCPVVYERNGAIYIYNVETINNNINRQRKYVMDEISSLDIDSEIDWIIVENILSKNID